MKKNINLKGIIICAIFLIFGITLIRQVTVLRNIQAEIVTKTQELEALKETNAKLQVELEKAHSDNDYLEKLARERLGLVKDEEKLISSTEEEE